MKRLALIATAAVLILAAVPRIEWRLMKLGLVSYWPIDPSEQLKQLPKTIPPRSIVMLGDSIARRAPWNGVNLGIDGLRSDQLDLHRYPSLHQARAVILSLGTNDVWQLRASGLGVRVARILRQISAPVYLLAISSHHPGVDEANRQLRLACQRGCAFIGQTRYLSRDDTHLAPEGYAELAARIRAYKL